MLASTFRRGSQWLVKAKSSGSSNKKSVASKFTAPSSYKSTGKQLIRTYADLAESSSTTTLSKTRDWNLKLNKLLLLRYHDEAASEYQKMLAEGTTPDTTTFLIMFDNFLGAYDHNALIALMADVQARGHKTWIHQLDAQLLEFTQSFATRSQAIDAHDKFVKYRRAGLNPFDPPPSK